MFCQGAHENHHALADRVVAGILRGVFKELLKDWQQGGDIVLLHTNHTSNGPRMQENITSRSKNKRYLSMSVQCREGSIKHAASHLRVAVVQSIRDKKEEERGDL